DRALRRPAGGDHDLLPARARPGGAGPPARARARAAGPRGNGRGAGRGVARVTAALRVAALSRRFGGVVAVREVDADVAPQEIVAVIGPNGAGKTTLFNLITGFLPPTSGDVYYQGRRITGWSASRVAALGVIRTFQNLLLFGEATVVENVMAGCHRWTRTGLLQAALALPAARREDRQVYDAAREALALVGLEDSGPEQARDIPVGQQ